MAILKSTVVNGDLTVTGSLNVQGKLTYVGVEDLRVKDKQIELNANDEGLVVEAGADQAGIVIRGARKTQDVNDDASILYNHADDTLVINKTIKGTVDKVANKLAVTVTNESGSTNTVEFDGSETKSVSVDLSGLQRQINSLTGDAGSIKNQIDTAINALNSNVTATANGTPDNDGVFVLKSVEIVEGAGKLTSATPTAVEVEKAGAAAAVKTALIGEDSDTKDSVTIKGAKKYADVLAAGKADVGHTHEISNVNGLQDKLNGYDAHLEDAVVHITANERTVWNGKQDKLSTAQLAAVDSGITADKVRGYDSHTGSLDIHVSVDDRKKWNAAQENAENYTKAEIEKLGTAAYKDVFTGTIADSTSEDLVTAAQVKAYAAGVVGAMHFRGAVEDTGSVANPASGDICLVGTKEYVFNGTDWVLFGDEGAYDTKGSATTAEQNAKTYADGLNTEMDKRVDALEAINHDAYIAADKTTLESAKSYADGLAAKKANIDHTHEISNVNGLQTALDGKAASSHTHAIADVTGLQTALDGKAASNHNHDSAYDVKGAAAAVKTELIGKGTSNKDSDTIEGAKKYADGKVAELNNTVNNLSAEALKSVVAGDYVSVSTKSANSQTISVTTKGVADASNSNNGLALAADVKKYVDDQNNTQNTSIQNNYVKKAGDTMTGKLTMSAADIEMSNNGKNGIVFGNMKIVWNSADGGAIEFIPTTA